MKVAFLNFLKYQKRYSDHTIAAYSKDISQFEEFLSKDNPSGESVRDLLTVNKHDIRAWIISLSDNDLSPKSINRKIISLRSLYKYLQRSGHCKNNPAESIPMLKISKKLPHFALEKPLNEAIEISKKTMPTGFSTLRDLLIIELLYGCGLRQAELMNLKINQIQQADQVLKVLGKRNKERIVPFPDTVNETLTAYMRFRSTFLSVKYNNDGDKEDSKKQQISITQLLLTDAGRPLYPMFINRKVKHFLTAIPALEKKNPHMLRHSYATHLLNNGAELAAVKDLLGHSSLASTQVYTHNSLEKLKRAYMSAHPKS